MEGGVEAEVVVEVVSVVLVDGVGRMNFKRDRNQRPLPWTLLWLLGTFAF